MRENPAPKIVRQPKPGRCAATDVWGHVCGLRDGHKGDHDLWDRTYVPSDEWTGRKVRVRGRTGTVERLSPFGGSALVRWRSGVREWLPVRKLREAE
jgi:hypothetical protein